MTSSVFLLELGGNEKEAIAASRGMPFSAAGSSVKEKTGVRRGVQGGGTRILRCSS